MSQFEEYQVENLRAVLASDKADLEKLLKDLAGYVAQEAQGNMDGLTISDLGNKISKLQGQLVVTNKVLHVLND